MKTKSFDLTSGEAGFQPFRLTSAHRDVLQRSVISAVRKASAASRVLATYSNQKSQWVIPPLYSGFNSTVSLQVGPSTVDRSYDLHEGFRFFIEKLVTSGWNGVTARHVKAVFGECAESPWLFDKSSVEVGRAALEYAMASSRVRGTRLFLQGDSAAVIYKGEPIGVIDGKIVGTSLSVTPDQIYEWLLAPRGAVITRHYGVYDRLYEWSGNDYESLTNIDGFRTALALLKLSMEPEEEAQAEQTLRQFALEEVPRGEEQIVSMSQIYAAKDAWLLTEGSDEARFQALFEQVVPYIFDSVKFKSLFGLLPEEDLKLTDRQVLRIENGLEKFTQACLKLRRDHERV